MLKDYQLCGEEEQSQMCFEDGVKQVFAAKLKDVFLSNYKRIVCL